MRGSSNRFLVLPSSSASCNDANDRGVIFLRTKISHRRNHHSPSNELPDRYRTLKQDAPFSRPLNTNFTKDPTSLVVGMTFVVLPNPSRRGCATGYVPIFPQSGRIHALRVVLNTKVNDSEAGRYLYHPR